MTMEKRRICQNCADWTPRPEYPKWGTCSSAKNTGYRKVYSSWCPEGRMARNQNGRYWNQPACKKRFKERKDTEP